MPATQPVILVDQNDQAIGTAEKLSAHRLGLCHRAFSIFIFRQHEGRREILLQQRAAAKYHSPNLWTNTCCSHPGPEDDLLEAGKKRLQEEMGFITPLHAVGRFHYHVQFDNGLIENEIDHVLIGTIDHSHIQMNPEEVQAWRWITLAALRRELSEYPQHFTFWLPPALDIACPSNPP